MSEVRWLGPYAQGERHADTVTIDHVIDLRKRLAEAERQRDNALNVCLKMKDEIYILRGKLHDLETKAVREEPCSCKKRDAELDKLFSEWNDD